jgi:nucleoprotein TPR
MTKKHLEEKFDDLTKRFHGNEEKLAVYGRRTGPSVVASQGTDENMSQEQRLESEVAELRSVAMQFITRCTSLQMYHL